MERITGLATTFAALVLASLAWAGVPQTINYQGYLKNSAGTPVSSPVQVVFSIYTAASGGSALWSETQSVTPANGVYSVQLGSVTPIPANHFSNDTLYLGIKVGSDAEMSPRQQLTTVPFAFRAGTADNVGIACPEGGVLVNRGGVWQCGVISTLPNATAICVGTDCAISLCSPGWADCNKSPQDGCEANLKTDTGNCGQCGNHCSPSLYNNFVRYCSSGACVNGYMVSGSVAGLLNSGLVLQNNGSDDMSVTANGKFSFVAPLTNGSSYQIAVKTQPAGQNCQITNGAGVLNGASVTNVAVTCSCQQWWPDADNDGYGDSNATSVSECVTSKPGYAPRGGDCNDSNAAINPGAIEVCDHVDNNCNGQIDEGVRFCNVGQTCCAWSTKSQYDTCMNDFLASGPPRNTALLPCVSVMGSTDPNYWLCYDPGDICDNTDNNCNGQIDEGHLKCGNPLHCPTAEACNGQDDNCDGQVDEGGVCGSCVWSFEVCDGCDNDCDGVIDNVVDAPPETCTKSDGSVGMRVCSPPVGAAPGSCIAGKGWGPCQ